MSPQPENLKTHAKKHVVCNGPKGVSLGEQASRIDFFTMIQIPMTKLRMQLLSNSKSNNKIGFDYKTISFKDDFDLFWLKMIKSTYL